MSVTIFALFSDLNPQIDPITECLPPFPTARLPQFESPSAKPPSIPTPLRHLADPASDTVASMCNFSGDTQDSTEDPTEDNPNATKMDSDPPDNTDRRSPCTCSICRREPHSPFNMGTEYIDQQYDCSQGRYRGAREGPLLQRSPALRRMHAGRAPRA